MYEGVDWIHVAQDRHQ